ncbi:folate-binding protein [Phaeovulum sp. NW3]|uniref:CAF17-like 4Fe-4S cluster assembly/insertion protein YgfZ n=1 Tax=Phaeovulum sp. NW3 TaxID=2934933 RepID=UPI002021A5B6|nr:folate-binding protein [Phaeovulum sp. NW3]MCL7464504.1 folate-binding protein [Phaeovulum sp. NW3]
MNERAIFRISGADRISFLQGLISNDARKLDAGPVYAALLAPQGKYLADFLLIPDGDTVLLDIAAPLAEATVKRLSMYRLRADVRIEPTPLQVHRGTGPAPTGAVTDPRHPALGWRLYGATGGDDGTDWDAIRVAHCIPETGIELTQDTYILEAGFERLNGVDFRKGCYVGQEVTARMKHKTELRKGLVTVRVQGSAPVGTPIEAAGRVVGTLYTQAGGRGIAHLRLDRAEGPMQAGAATVSLD